MAGALMANTVNQVTVAFSTTLTLNEVEIQALEAITCYGVDSFLEVFKKNLGTAYIRDHEEGVRSLFKAIGRDVLPAHRAIVQARADLREGTMLRIQRERDRKSTRLNSSH